MAQWMEPTPEQVEGYNKWVEERPPIVRDIGRRLNPWELYSLGEQRVTVHSIMEDGTVTIKVLAKFNFLLMERTVFGIDPDDLTPCDLPGPDVPVGIFMAPEDAIMLIEKRRKENGAPALDEGEKAQILAELRRVYEEDGVDV